MLTISPTAQARILEETGTLRGFLFGTCEECTYDNLVAHMSEGIARANYNVYNPLDPQNDEFGDYQLIPSGIPGDLLLASWRSVFERMIEGDYSGAEATREDLLPEYPFEIVHLTDTETGRDYYILREQIDSSFVDVNQMEIEEDDVVGSFAYGWGVYVYATDAMHPRVTVQVVHPNDDYICPYVAFDFFQTINAGQLFSTTAGREVRWTQIGYYTNSKSLSDPS